MIRLDTDLWWLSYPLKLVGLDLRRNVAVIRLASGRLVVHSSGPFSSQDVDAIDRLGTVGWVVEAMLRHDTFSRQGRRAFPDATFLAPEGFGERVNFSVQPIFPTPLEWTGQLETLELQGVPSMKETVFFHRGSRTLIVADLVFNFPTREALWSELMLKAAVGSKHRPGMSRPFKQAIKDEAAFRNSIETMMEWDFDRVIVGHGEPITRDGRKLVGSMLHEAGYYEKYQLK
jgi:hypothetical protein